MSDHLEDEGNHPLLRRAIEAARADRVRPEHVDAMLDGFHRKMAAPSASSSSVRWAMGGATGLILVGFGVWWALRPAPQEIAPASHDAAQEHAVTPIEPSVEPVIVREPEALEAAEEPAPAPPSKRLVRRRSHGSSDSTPAPIDEIELIDRARAVLARNPAQALQLANRHASEFPEGVVADEREVIAIEALHRLDRNEQARARAERFERMRPGSPYRSRIRALFGSR